jgi:hypothetical protein
MNRSIKSKLLMMAGFCWLAFAALIALFLCNYLVGGAGLQGFGFWLPMSGTTIVLGVAHFIGFAAAACLCLAIGAGLFVRGRLLSQEPEPVKPQKGAGNETDAPQ